MVSSWFRGLVLSWFMSLIGSRRYVISFQSRVFPMAASKLPKERRIVLSKRPLEFIECVFVTFSSCIRRCVLDLSLCFVFVMYSSNIRCRASSCIRRGVFCFIVHSLPATLPLSLLLWHAIFYMENNMLLWCKFATDRITSWCCGDLSDCIFDSQRRKVIFLRSWSHSRYAYLPHPSQRRGGL